jgi:hypothetical protein
MGILIYNKIKRNFIMKRFWQLLRAGCWRTSLLWGCLAAFATDAWAKGEATKDSGDSGSRDWILPYIIVVLCIALGMLVVCKSSGRRDRAKPEAYGEGKDLAAETEEEEKKKT